MMDPSFLLQYLRKRFSPAVQYAGSVLFIIQTLFYMAIVLFAPAIALEAGKTYIVNYSSNSNIERK